MEIQTIDSKNLIITTEYGSKIEIKDNQKLIFGNNEISLKNIKEIGDFTNDVDEDNLIQTISSINKILGFIKIYIIIISILTIYEFFSWSNISKSPIFLYEVGMLLGGIIIYFSYLSQISILNKIDFSKNNYPLIIICEFLNGKEKLKKKFNVCNGSMKELKEIKKIIASKKIDSLLN